MRVHDTCMLAEVLASSVQLGNEQVGQRPAEVCGRIGAFTHHGQGGRPTTRPLPPRARAAARIADAALVRQQHEAEAKRLAALEEAKRQGRPLPQTQNHQIYGCNARPVPASVDIGKHRTRFVGGEPTEQIPASQKQHHQVTKQPFAKPSTERGAASFLRASRPRSAPHATKKHLTETVPDEATPLGHTARLGVKRTIFWPAKVIRAVGPVAGVGRHRSAVDRGLEQRVGFWEAGVVGPPGGWLAPSMLHRR